MIETKANEKIEQELHSISITKVSKSDDFEDEMNQLIEDFVFQENASINGPPPPK